MTSLPHSPASKKLGLVIDLDVCVGCHACVISCKEWNTGGYGSALSDQHAYGADVSGTFLNRIHSFEVVPEGGLIIGEAGEARVVHFPKLPALRRCTLRNGVPNGSLIQACRRRYSAGGRG